MANTNDALKDKRSSPRHVAYIVLQKFLEDLASHDNPLPEIKLYSEALLDNLDEAADIGAPQSVLSMGQIIVDESDRGCVLVAASFLEQELGSLLSAFFVEGDEAKQLLRVDGPLGSFSSRIDASLALGLISRDVGRQLHLIRKIRNEFAHSVEATFDNPGVRDRCRALSPSDDHEPLRTTFTSSFILLVFILHLLHLTIQRRKEATLAPSPLGIPEVKEEFDKLYAEISARFSDEVLQPLAALAHSAVEKPE